jgi:hypothetical protein
MKPLNFITLLNNMKVYLAYPDAATVAVHGARTSPPPINIGKKLKKPFDRREKSDTF